VNRRAAGAENPPHNKQGEGMRIDRWIGAALLATAALMTSGCAVNRATGSVEPGANLAAIKKIHVVRAAEDTREVNALLAERLTQMGYEASTSAAKRTDVDAVMTYVDRWMWDITMYMIELTVVLRDPRSDFPLAKANSFHTSLTRLSPKEMVQEVTTNMFKDAKK
jgi:hypothetical protein